MQFTTERGVVDVVNTSPDHYGLFLKEGNEFLGVVTEGYEDTHVAHPGDDRSPKRHQTLKDAVLWIGKDR